MAKYLLLGATTVLTILAVGISESTAQAEGMAPPCGELRDKTFFLKEYQRYFTGEKLHPVREAWGIDRLSEEVPIEVVDEKKVCGRAFGQFMAHLGKTGEQKRVRKEKLDYAIFRYGPYYAVLVDASAEDRDSIVSTGWGRLYVFRAGDMRFVGSAAV